MRSISGKFGLVAMTLYAVVFFGFVGIANAGDSNDASSSPSDLSWEQAEQMIKDWVEKNWHEKVIDVKPLSEGGMENTTERHQGSFEGWTWDTGEKTVTTDFVFKAGVKALNSKGKELNHKIRFHFDEGPRGWFIKSAGVM
ncbi:MAG: hypothetical protein ACI9ZT_001744 [Gammaproteobacteria bacterium]|jgi:hypothetical protein